MSNNFTIDQLTKAQTLDPNSINRLYKINMMLNFMEIRSNNPRMTQNQICKQLGTSDSTIKRYRDDIKMDSPYNRNNDKKRKPRKETDESPKNKIIEKRIKNKLKNEMKGGDISNNHSISSKEIIEYAFKDSTSNGKQLIEQAFNTNINDWFHWNYTERHQITKRYIKYYW